MLKVLIAEDDLMIADAAEEVLVEWGYEVCGIARTVDQAVALGRLHRHDLAIIDLRLAEGGWGSEIVFQLNELDGLGVLYATGNGAKVPLSTARGHACLVKPYNAAALVRALEIVKDMAATGVASQPFPRGFRLLQLETVLPSAAPR